MANYKKNHDSTITAKECHQVNDIILLVLDKTLKGIRGVRLDN